MEYIKGVVVEKNPMYVVVETNDIGYKLNISLLSSEALPEMGKSVKIYVYTHIKEDAHTLYGFCSSREREVFLLLISVSGVGPSIARAICSRYSGSEIISLIVNEQVVELQKVKGIGAKSAKRIILDLKDKALALNPDVQDDKTPINSVSQMVQEAISALSVLGVDAKRAKAKIDECLKQEGINHSTENLIKYTLKSL